MFHQNKIPCCFSGCLGGAIPYRRSADMSRTIRLICRGLLYAATDLDKVIRKSAVSFLYGMADLFVGFLVLGNAESFPLSQLCTGSQSLPIDPMEFIVALTGTIDLSQWAVTCLSIQVSKFVTRLPSTSGNCRLQLIILSMLSSHFHRCVTFYSSSEHHYTIYYRFVHKFFSLFRF